jgi:hypothetical protein
MASTLPERTAATAAARHGRPWHAAARALTIAAVTAIAQTGIPGGEAAGAMAIFILVGSLSILAPVVIYFALGAKATPILEDVKTWMAAHNAAIMAVLLIVLGAKLIGDAVAGLSA